MKTRKNILLISIIFTLLFGCDEYKTHVINTVHPDGSVTRLVTMRTEHEEIFESSEYQVPVDSTWNIKEFMEVSDNQDTLWVLEAEKHFKSVNEINAGYETDSGANQHLDRRAEFSKSYRWFNTVYRYSENVKSIMDPGFADIDDFMNEKEQKHYFLPEFTRNELENGSDSLLYRELRDSAENGFELYTWSNLMEQWYINISELLEDKPGFRISGDEWQYIKPNLLQYAKETDDIDFSDSLLTELFGEEFILSCQIEMDSAVSMLEDIVDHYLEAESYEMEIRMPGTPIATNGYLDTGKTDEQPGGILWTVSGDYFLADNYEMWVESRSRNDYAWIISGLFLLFVFFGLIRFRRSG